MGAGGEVEVEGGGSHLRLPIDLHLRRGGFSDDGHGDGCIFQRFDSVFGVVYLGLELFVVFRLVDESLIGLDGVGDIVHPIVAESNFFLRLGRRDEVVGCLKLGKGAREIFGVEFGLARLVVGTGRIALLFLRGSRGCASLGLCKRVRRHRARRKQTA
ncbi:MAG: hypothetical protein BWY17_05145 [Deltaproteobacteria bacterium ADurb.Bin207]|nr:MAG: hypothetical protein BWY17_05145 [Deltaproteobacteria bacterium ADurb.Bin207]